jgi:hypothetical protein
LSSELLDELESEDTDWDHPDFWVQNVDWTRVAHKVGLDKGERMVLKWKLYGESRDSVMARQRSQEKRLEVQAAWRRFDRKWPEIAEAVKRSHPKPQVTQPPSLPSVSRAVSAPEALQRLKERHEAEKKKRRLEPSSLPTLPRYADYSL